MNFRRLDACGCERRQETESIESIQALQIPEVFLPERDYVTLGYMLSQIRLSSVCLSSVTFVHPTKGVETFGDISSPERFWTC